MANKLYDMLLAKKREQDAARAGQTSFYTSGGLLNDEAGVYGRARQRGGAVTDDAVARMQTFDASKGLDEYARGAYSKISTALGSKLESMGGEAVGQGRFDSGFFDKDKGQVVRNVMDDFTANLSTQALGAQGQQQANDARLLGYGQDQEDTANDILMARRQEFTDDAAARKARRDARRRGIGTAIGGLVGAGAGAMMGGPAGAQAGWQIGSGAGSYA